MIGILNVNKPPGWTSRDVVNRVQRFVRPHKVGHAGTLDPLATGVLVVCVGKATRLIEYVQRMPKTYRAAFLLGRSSASDDVDTEVTPLVRPTIPTAADITAALPKFVGTIAQVPPAYSAVKIDGQRAYKLARQGKEVAITERLVQIYHIDLESYEYPRLELVIRCGSGTYVRSLGRDLAASLGTAAVMAELVRERIGPFQVSEAISVDDLDRTSIESHLQPAASAVRDLPALVLSADQLQNLCYGRPLAIDIHAECAALDDAGNLIAILKPRSPGVLTPHINFAGSA